MSEESRELNEKAAINDFREHLADLLGDLWSEEMGKGEASSARKSLGYEKGFDPITIPKKNKKENVDLAKSQVVPSSN